MTQFIPGVGHVYTQDEIDKLLQEQGGGYSAPKPESFLGAPSWGSLLGDDKLMQDPYRLEGGPAIEVDQRGIEEMRRLALGEEQSPWLQLQLQKIGEEQKAQREAGAQQALGGQQQAMSALAMKGGLRGGAAERIARGGAEDIFNVGQEISRWGAGQRLGAEQAAEEQRLQMLSQLPQAELQYLEPQFREREYQTGIEQYNIEQALGEHQQRRQAELEKYKEDMAAWGAERTAEAQEQAGK